MYKEAFKFDLDTYTRKPAGPPSFPADCLVAVGVSPNNEFTIRNIIKFRF